ncbi:MAG: FHA domain-containing protein [Polyangiales bacterium]
MIVCPKCGKENQDHYKFCLGCGNELPRNPDAQRPFRAPTPPAGRQSSADFPPPPQPPQGFPPAPQGFPPPQSQPQQPAFQPPQPQPVNFAPPPQPQPPQPQPEPSQRPAASPPSSCPQCASPNPRGNRFCITCGFDMAAAPQQQPPPPVSQPQQPAFVQQPSAPPQQAPVGPAYADTTEQGHTQGQGHAHSAPERAKLVLIRPDGSEGATWSLTDGENPIGRDVGGPFAQDMYLSPRHATFVIANGSVTVRDEDSLNGIYVRIERQQPVELRDGDVFRIGQEILRFESFPPVGRQADGTEKLGAEVEGLVGKIVLLTGRESYASAFPVPVTGLYLGRERGDILFPEDGYVSGLHCQLAVAGGRLTLTDVGSSNGSYVRLRAGRQLRNGDFLLLGQQLFRLQTA